MTNLDRIKLLKQFLEDDPADPFNLYALGLEYLKENPDHAKFYFDKLLKNHDLYVPTYYHAGMLYAEQGEKENAIQILKKGIQVCSDQKDFKTQRELQTLLTNLEVED